MTKIDILDALKYDCHLPTEEPEVWSYLGAVFDPLNNDPRCTSHESYDESSFKLQSLSKSHVNWASIVKNNIQNTTVYITTVAVMHGENVCMMLL